MTRDQAIARADAMLESVFADYPKHLEATFTEMAALAAAENWDALHVAAHDLKGQAGTCGWPIIGLVARSLDAALKTGDEAHFPDAAKVHLACMRLCLGASIQSPNPAIEKFLQELDDLVARMGRHAEKAEATAKGT
ncbi:MAG: Hpt domain-containing protein [Alphaproteobacteria bacterium]|nr:Hpt domain-containing protein [Alphaproteobacteria bacterium]